MWFVLRDFKKSNANSPAYKRLPALGIECFTPMHWVINQRTKRKEYVPVIRNLLFANSSRQELEPIIEETPKLQFIYIRGGAQGTPMTVSDDEMTRFINAVNNDPSPLFYSPDELTADMLGKEIEVKGGPMDGYRGRLLKMQGSKRKRLIIEIKGFLAAAIEVSPEYIALL